MEKILMIVRMPPELKEQLTAEAKRRRISRNDLITEYVKKHLEITSP